MKGLVKAFRAEILKNKGSSIVWGTFIAFALAPLMGAVFIYMVQSPQIMAKAGSLALKVKAMNFNADWRSYFSLLTQALGVGGVFLFGFVTSWLFGREYSQGTVKDLLSLPTSRSTILNAKFIVYIIWCLALAVSNILVGFLLGLILGLPATSADVLMPIFKDYIITTLLTLVLGTPIAYFAMRGKGYLMPLGFVALTIVFAQVIAAIGFGVYFPWSIPGIYSGMAEEYKSQLNIISYSGLAFVGIIGYISTLLYWKIVDQTK
jgi:ABC-type transport system involved in multi-copper enzyme maturation permease subunit